MSGPPASDNTQPSITALTAAPGAGGSATLKWTTDEASDSNVAYGPTPTLGSTTGNATLVTSHSVTLTGLTPGATYYYRVSSRDASGNNATEPPTPASFTMPSVTTVTAFPARTTILNGTFRAGSAASLAANDNVFYQVNSTTFYTRTASAYAAFTGVSKSLSNLSIAYSGKNSISCNQTISIWRWTTNSWVQLDSRVVGTSEIALNLTPTGTLANFVSGTSGTGELRVRVSCSASTTFYASWDLMSITYTAP
jgi:hypothetical protein